MDGCVFVGLVVRTELCLYSGVFYSCCIVSVLYELCYTGVCCADCLVVHRCVGILAVPVVFAWYCVPLLCTGALYCVGEFC